jgi:hypothetical protein
MKNRLKQAYIILRVATLLAMLLAVASLTVKATMIYGPLAALPTLAIAFFIGTHMLDVKWTPRARLCTNDISLTGITEIIYAARDQVCAEPAGFSQGVMVNSDTAGISTGGTVTSLRTIQPTVLTSYTPAMVPPDAADVATDTESLTLNLVAGTQIPMKGEVFLKLANTVGAEVALQQLMAQGLRTIRNQIEKGIALAAKNGASRATGTAGTAPFAANFNTIAQVRQILEDNGAPMEDGQLSLIINTLAGTNLRNLSTLYKANEAGGDDLLRRGELLNLHGFSIRSSAGVASHTAGTASSATTDNAGYAIGANTLTLASAGTGTLLAGDVITLAGDTNNYVLKSGDADVSNGGSFVLNQPGLRTTLSAATKAITVGSAYTGNSAFHKSAIELAMRPPAQPPGGDAGEHNILIDEKTGFVFDAVIYKGRGMNLIEIFTIYGVKVWKPEFVGTLMG